MYQIGFFLLAVLAGVLPFAAPGPCKQALREGLVLCGGPLLLSLFPFLVVSSLLMQCPASDLLAVPFRPLARGIGVHSPCAARVLMIGFFGGFAPALRPCGPGSSPRGKRTPCCPRVSAPGRPLWC